MKHSTIIGLLALIFLTTASAFATQVTIVVTNFAFTPSSPTILRSDTVRWTKAAAAGLHGVHSTSTPVAFNFPQSSSAWAYSVKFDSVALPVDGSGNYPYVCPVHATMTGIIHVQTTTVNSPNGGEVLSLGNSQNITWSSTNITGNVMIELNRSFPSASWETLFASTANDGSESWTVAGATSSTCRIRISSVTTPAVKDTSNADFSIQNPPASITVTAPNGGENWNLGCLQNITWNSANLTGNVMIEMNRSFPSASWETLFASTANDNSESWIVSGVSSTTCRIRITSINFPTVKDTSNANFTIPVPSITVLAPNGAETWFVGSGQTISWNSADFCDVVNIELNRNYPFGGWESLFAGITNDGSELWTVSGAVGANCRVSITAVNVPSVTDTSDANFSIQSVSPATILVLQPNGGENWFVGSNQNINWSSANLAGNVHIDLNRNFPVGVWTRLFTDVPNDGSQPWPVIAPESVTCRIKVISADDTTVNDISDANFTILSLGTPTNLTALAVGNDIQLNWQPVPFADGYNIYSSTNSEVPPVFNNLVGTTNGTTLTDVGVVSSNQILFYQVRAFKN